MHIYGMTNIHVLLHNCYALEESAVITTSIINANYVEKITQYWGVMRRRRRNTEYVCFSLSLKRSDLNRLHSIVTILLIIVWNNFPKMYYFFFFWFLQSAKAEKVILFKSVKCFLGMRKKFKPPTR